MKNKKLLLGSCMLFIAMTLMYVNIYGLKIEQNHQELTNSSFLDIEKFPIKVDSEFLELSLNENDSLISVVAILSTKVCPSCVSNTLEFIKEAQKRNEFRKAFNIRGCSS